MNKEIESVTYYFQAKSLKSASTGSANPISQNTGLPSVLGIVPEYSVEKFNLGATVPYAGKNANHINILPGIAMT